MDSVLAFGLVSGCVWSYKINFLGAVYKIKLKGKINAVWPAHESISTTKQSSSMTIHSLTYNVFKLVCRHSYRHSFYGLVLYASLEILIQNIVGLYSIILVFIVFSSTS